MGLLCIGAAMAQCRTPRTGRVTFLASRSDLASQQNPDSQDYSVLNTHAVPNGTGMENYTRHREKRSFGRKVFPELHDANFTMLTDSRLVPTMAPLPAGVMRSPSRGSTMMLGGVLPNVESSRHNDRNGAPAGGGHRRAYAECTPLAQFGTNFDSMLLKKHSIVLSPQAHKLHKRWLKKFHKQMTQPIQHALPEMFPLSSSSNMSTSSVDSSLSRKYASYQPYPLQPGRGGGRRGTR